MNISFLRIKPFQKLVAFITVVNFAWTQVATGAPFVFSDGVMPLAVGASLKSAPALEIPGDLAIVKEAYGTFSADEPTFIYIEDAHANYDAQLKIKDLLKFLHEKEGIDLALLEGATSPFNPDRFRFFPKEEYNLELAEALAKKGLVTGAELFLLEADKNYKALGIESHDLYVENLKAFRRVLDRKQESEKFLALVTSQLIQIENHLLNTDLKDLLRADRSYKEGTQNIFSFLQMLTKEANRRLNLDLTDPYSQIHWPQLMRLALMEKAEKELDQKKIGEEEKAFIQKLKELQVTSDLVQSIEALLLTKSVDEPLKYRGVRLLFEHVYAEAEPKGLRFEDYPALTRKVGLLIFRDELVVEDLEEEITRLTDTLSDALSKNETERTVLRLAKDVFLLREACTLDLTQNTLEEFRDRMEELKPANLLARIGQLRSRGVSPRISSAGQDAPPTSLDATLSDIDAFYTGTEARDKFFIEKAFGELKANKRNKAVLITGGFHTSGVTKALREKNASFMVVTPKITEIDKDRSLYYDVMAERTPTRFNRSQIVHPLVGAETWEIITTDAGRDPQIMTEVTLGTTLDLAEQYQWDITVVNDFKPEDTFVNPRAGFSFAGHDSTGAPKGLLVNTGERQFIAPLKLVTTTRLTETTELRLTGETISRSKNMRLEEAFVSQEQGFGSSAEDTKSNETLAALFKEMLPQIRTRIVFFPYKTTQMIRIKKADPPYSGFTHENFDRSILFNWRGDDSTWISPPEDTVSFFNLAMKMGIRVFGIGDRYDATERTQEIHAFFPSEVFSRIVPSQEIFDALYRIANQAGTAGFGASDSRSAQPPKRSEGGGAEEKLRTLGFISAVASAALSCGVGCATGRAVREMQRPGQPETVAVRLTEPGYAEAQAQEFYDRIVDLLNEINRLRSIVSGGHFPAGGEIILPRGELPLDWELIVTRLTLEGADPVIIAERIRALEEALHSLADMVKVLSPEERQAFLPVLIRIQNAAEAIQRAVMEGKEIRELSVLNLLEEAERLLAQLQSDIEDKKTENNAKALQAFLKSLIDAFKKLPAFDTWTVHPPAVTAPRAEAVKTGVPVEVGEKEKANAVKEKKQELLRRTQNLWGRFRILMSPIQKETGTPDSMLPIPPEADILELVRTFYEVIDPDQDLPELEAQLVELEKIIGELEKKHAELSSEDRDQFIQNLRDTVNQWHEQLRSRSFADTKVREEVVKVSIRDLISELRKAVRDFEEERFKLQAQGQEGKAPEKEKIKRVDDSPTAQITQKSKDSIWPYLLLLAAAVGGYQLYRSYQEFRKSRPYFWRDVGYWFQDRREDIEDLWWRLEDLFWWPLETWMIWSARRLEPAPSEPVTIEEEPPAPDQSDVHLFLQPYHAVLSDLGRFASSLENATREKRRQVIKSVIEEAEADPPVLSGWPDDGLVHGVVERIAIQYDSLMAYIRGELGIPLRVEPSTHFATHFERFSTAVRYLIELVRAEQRLRQAVRDARVFARELEPFDRDFLETVARFDDDMTVNPYGARVDASIAILQAAQEYAPDSPNRLELMQQHAKFNSLASAPRDAAGFGAEAGKGQDADKTPDEEEAARKDQLLPVRRDTEEHMRALAKGGSEGAIQLPAKLDDKLLEAAASDPTQLMTRILGDQELVRKLLETQVWADANQLRDDLRAASAGQPNDKTIEAVRLLKGAVTSGLKGSHVGLVLAHLLMQRRLRGPEFMLITNEILRDTDAALAENLEGLLKSSSEIQMRSFQWLFDRMLKEAEEILTDRSRSERHLLTFGIILQQINRVLSEADKKDWLELQIHIVMRFAGRIADESKQREKPFMGALLVFYPKVSRDFFLAVDTQFLNVAGIYQKDPNAAILKKYGGYESYDQAIETILSFAVLAWPDEFFDYLKSRFTHGTKTMQAQYLNSMKYGIHRDPESRAVLSEHAGRLAFILANLMALGSEKSTFIQAKLNEIMQAFPNEVIAYLLEDRRYFKLGDRPRSFLIEFILRVSTAGLIEGGRGTVREMVMFEIRREANLEIKGKILLSDYFNDEFLGTLAPGEAKALRTTILDGYETFRKTDLLDKQIKRIMTFFGMASVKETFAWYKQHLTTNYDKAVAALHLAAHVASLVDAKGDKEAVAELARYLRKIAKLAKDLSMEKQVNIKDYYAYREEAAKAYGDLEGLDDQVLSVTAAARTINAKVAEFDKEEADLRREQQGLEHGKDVNGRSVQAGYAYQDQLHEQIGKFPWRQRFAASFSVLLGSWAYFFINFWSKSKPKAGEEHKVETMVEAKPGLRQLYLNLRVSEQSLSETEGRNAEISGRLSAIKARFKAIEPEKAKAQKELVAMSEAVNEVSTKQKKLKENLEKLEKNLLPLHLEWIANARKKAADYHAALRLFLKSPSLTAEMAADTAETLRLKEKENEDGPVLISMLGLAVDARFPGIIDPEAVKQRIAAHLNYQAEHGLFKSEVLDLVHDVTERVRKGDLIPQSTGDVLYKTIQDLFRKKLNAPDLTKEMARQDLLQSESRKWRKHVTKEVVSDVYKIISASDLAGGAAFRDFLKLKFKDDEDLIKDLLTVLFYFVMEHGPEKAIESFFHLISGEEGYFFVRPETEEIGKPKNRAEQIEKRYRKYYEMIQQTKKTIHETQRKIFQLEEGYGWDREANNAALYYFTVLFNSAAVSDDALRIDAEKTLWLLAIHPWLIQEDVSEEEKKKKELKEAVSKKKSDKNEITLDDYAVLANIEAYLSEAPQIDRLIAGKPPGQRIQGRHDTGFLVGLAYFFAMKVIKSIATANISQLRYELVILEKMQAIMNPSIAYVYKIGQETHSVPVLGLLKEAAALVKRHLPDGEPLHGSQKALPPSPRDFALSSKPGQPSQPLLSRDTDESKPGPTAGFGVELPNYIPVLDSEGKPAELTTVYSVHSTPDGRFGVRGVVKGRNVFLLQDTPSSPLKVVTEVVDSEGKPAELTWLHALHMTPDGRFGLHGQVKGKGAFLQQETPSSPLKMVSAVGSNGAPVELLWISSIHSTPDGRFGVHGSVEHNYVFFLQETSSSLLKVIFQVLDSEGNPAELTSVYSVHSTPDGRFGVHGVVKGENVFLAQETPSSPLKIVPIVDAQGNSVQLAQVFSMLLFSGKRIGVRGMSDGKVTFFLQETISSPIKMVTQIRDGTGNVINLNLASSVYKTPGGRFGFYGERGGKIVFFLQESPSSPLKMVPIVDSRGNPVELDQIDHTHLTPNGRFGVFGGPVDKKTLFLQESPSSPLKMVTLLDHDGNPTELIWASSIISTAEGRFGVLGWVGKKRVFIFEKSKGVLEVTASPVLDVAQFADGTIWYAQPDGLHRFIPSAGFGSWAQDRGQEEQRPSTGFGADYDESVEPPRQEADRRGDGSEQLAQAVLEALAKHAGVAVETLVETVRHQTVELEDLRLDPLGVEFDEELFNVLMVQPALKPYEEMLRNAISEMDDGVQLSTVEDVVVLVKAITLLPAGLTTPDEKLLNELITQVRGQKPSAGFGAGTEAGLMGGGKLTDGFEGSQSRVDITNVAFGGHGQFDGRYIFSQRGNGQFKHGHIFHQMAYLLLYSAQSVANVFKAFTKSVELAAEVLENNRPLALAGIFWPWLWSFWHGRMLPNFRAPVNLSLPHKLLMNRQYHTPLLPPPRPAGFGAGDDETRADLAAVKFRLVQKGSVDFPDQDEYGFTWGEIPLDLDDRPTLDELTRLLNLVGKSDLQQRFRSDTTPRVLIAQDREGKIYFPGLIFYHYPEQRYYFIDFSRESVPYGGYVTSRLMSGRELSHIAIDKSKNFISFPAGVRFNPHGESAEFIITPSVESGGQAQFAGFGAAIAPIAPIEKDAGSIRLALPSVGEFEVQPRVALAFLEHFGGNDVEIATRAGFGIMARMAEFTVPASFTPELRKETVETVRPQQVVTKDMLSQAESMLTALESAVDIDRGVPLLMSSNWIRSEAAVKGLTRSLSPQNMVLVTDADTAPGSTELVSRLFRENVNIIPLHARILDPHALRNRVEKILPKGSKIGGVLSSVIGFKQGSSFEHDVVIRLKNDKPLIVDGEDITARVHLDLIRMVRLLSQIGDAAGSALKYQFLDEIGLKNMGPSGVFEIESYQAASLILDRLFHSMTAQALISQAA